MLDALLNEVDIYTVVDMEVEDKLVLVEEVEEDRELEVERSV
jgi:hypothetical protein